MVTRRTPWFLSIGVCLALVMGIVGCAPAAAPPTATPKAAAPTAPTAAPASPAPATSVPSGQAPSQPVAGTKKIVIGFTTSATGSMNLPSKKQIEGLRLWLDNVTKAGGIKLKDGTVLMPEIKYYDDESKTDRVQALYTKLINEDKVDFLISPYSSGLARAAAVVSEQNGKVMITTGAADDSTMEQGFKNIYQMYTPGSRYLIGAIDMFKELDPTAKKIAIVYEKDSFSTAVAKAAEPYAKSKGYEVTVYDGYDSGTTDFAPFINKIIATSPDAILGGGHFQDGTTFAKQLYEKKIQTKFVALLVAPPEPTFSEIGDAAQYIVGPSQWEPDATYSPDSAKKANLPWYGITVKDFVDGYKAKFNSMPSYHSAGGYAAALMLQKAIEDSDSVDRAKVVAALDKLNLMTFYGHVQFGTDAKTHGKQVAHDMIYIQWQKDSAGKLGTKIVWPPAAQSASPQLRK
ncbi:MAG: amino acid ABC transporter substrate-binding protein [Chloroflexi bacterium]|nr:amino acid ABC transporter substrate-binding protein [Chloroflexota bacterium]